MPHEAFIRLRYDSEEIARAVYEAVEPDNRSLPKGLVIRGRVEGKAVVFEISCEKDLGSLWSTLDDLLACIQTAERALRAAGAQ